MSPEIESSHPSDPLVSKPLFLEFREWVNDGVTCYQDLPPPLRRYLYGCFMSIVQNVFNEVEYQDIFITKHKNVEAWVLQLEKGKTRPKWKQMKNNVGYSDPSYFTVRRALETIALNRTLTKPYRDLDRAQGIRTALILNPAP